MANRSRVPKFGNWENEENVPYTMYFDKARKGRTGGPMINPNDPEENQNILSDYDAPAPAPAPAPASKIKAEAEKPLGQGAVRTTYENWRNREESDFKQFRESPARQDDMNKRAAAESTHQRGGRVVSSGETYKRPVRNSAGSENSFERSPLHNQARTTPGRSRMRPTPSESPDRGAAVPKFGAWDENNPSSADGYTHIFNKVREERGVGGKVPGMSTSSPYRPVHRPSSDDNVKSCCFPWGRK